MNESKKIAVTVKNVIRAALMLCIIFVFCPSFLVSCSGQSMNVSVMTAVGGVSMYGERVVDPHPVMLICLILPIVMFVFLFIKKFSEKRNAVLILTGSAVDAVVWILFAIAVKNKAEENYCEFKVTAWYVINMIVLLLICAVCLMILLNKISMEAQLGGQTFSTDVQGNTAERKNSADLGAFVKKVKEAPKSILIGAGIGILALIVIICVCVNARSTINLNKYITIETTGYDGYGRTSVQIDWEAIEQKYGNKISFTGQAQKEYGEWIGMITPMDAIEECINVSLDHTDKLSNGDVISYTWNVDEEISKYVKCKLKYKDDTYTVAGLEEVGTFDAFADLEVVFDGISPNGVAHLNYSGAELSSYDFYCEKSYGLRNGDQIVVSINEDQIEYYAESLGMVPTSLENTYMVEGLDEYMESFADIPADFVEKLKSEAEDTIYAYTAGSYGSKSSLSGLQYEGYLMRSVKDNAEYVSFYNDVFMIFSGTVSNSEGSFEPAKVFFPVQFKNILKTQEGMSYSSNDGILGTSNLGDSWWYSTKGYVNPVICYVDMANTYNDSYRIECGDGFEMYSEYESVENLAGISDAYKETVYADAKHTVETYIQSEYSAESTASELNVLGEYFLLAKDQNADISQKNAYIVVCSATVSNTKGRFEPVTVYFPVEYRGILKIHGDEYMFSSTEGIKGYSYFPNSYYTTSGYVDEAEMYSDLVTARRDNYTYEVSDSLKTFE